MSGSRANLNGGKLNGEGLKYPKGVSKLRQIKQRSAHVPDRSKWRRCMISSLVSLGFTKF